MKLLLKTVLMRSCVTLAFLFGAFLSTTAQAQSLSVSGRIVDGTNLPVMGAGIMEKGSSNGTVSDLDGQFTIETKADAILVISCLGYDSKEVAVNGSEVINIVLNASTEFLEDVVVGQTRQMIRLLVAVVGRPPQTEGVARARDAVCAMEHKKLYWV